MRYTVEMASDGMIYIPSFMKTDSGIQKILRLLPRQFERLYYWYYKWEGLVNYAVAMTLGGMIYIPNLMKISSSILGTISTIWEAIVLVLLTRGIYDPRHWDGLRWHDILVCIPNLMKIGTGVQALLRFCLSNLDGCNVGIIDGSGI
jgi:hypothetical protein